MNTNARSPNLRLLPPKLVFLLLLAILVLHWLVPGPELLPGLWRILGAPVSLLGLVLAARAPRQFKRLGTNIKTFDDPGKLVTSGLFRSSRNPMYLGFALLWLGAALMTGGACALAAPLMFAAISRWLYIPFEEAAMARVFGEDYRAYRQRVRRWL